MSSITDVLSKMVGREAEVRVLGQVRPERDPTVELYVPLPEHDFAIIVRHRRPAVDARVCRSCGYARHLCGCIAFDQPRPDYSTRWDSGPAEGPEED